MTPSKPAAEPAREDVTAADLLTMADIVARCDQEPGQGLTNAGYELTEEYLRWAASEIVGHARALADAEARGRREVERQHFKVLARLLPDDHGEEGSIQEARYDAIMEVATAIRQEDDGEGKP